MEEITLDFNAAPAGPKALDAEQPPEVLACRVAALWRGCVLARGTSGG